MKHLTLKLDQSEFKSMGRTLMAVVIGSCLCAIATNTFFLPNHLLSSGLNGLCILLNYAFGWSVSLTYLLLNIPLFFLVIYFFGLRSLISTILGTICFSMAVKFIPALPIQYSGDLTTVLLGGLIYGAGIGLILRYGGTTGGVDIIARLLNKFFAVSMGVTSLVFNAIVLTVFSFTQGLDPAVLTLSAIFIASTVNDYVNEGLDKRRSAMIVTNKKDELAQAIMKTLGRGVTIIDAQGAYTGEEHYTLNTVLSTWQVPKLKRLVLDIDPHAFMTITETVGVYGNGKGFHNIKEDD